MQAVRCGLYPLGETVATLAALRAIKGGGQTPQALLARHHAGDWGNLDADDKRANDDALRCGARLLSAYHLRTGKTVWCITEADRSSTTLLLPDEY